MTKQEALKVLATILGQLKLTVAEHAHLQKALEVLASDPDPTAKTVKR